jgi:hypothetical protein
MTLMHSSFASVVVNTTHLLASTVHETEDDSILLIHADTIEAGQISFELLEPIRRRNPQIIKRCARIQHIEFLLYPAPKCTRQLASGFAVAPMKNVGCPGVRKTDNHRY